jgi:hypothetical protein
VSARFVHRPPVLAAARSSLRIRARARLAGGWLALLAAGPAAAQNPYSYAKFSLQVPWTLYFVFLALIAVPFAVTMLLAWRSRGGEDEPQASEVGSGQESPSTAPEDDQPA